jgi:asparagine synthase (glutamine-hydrolysing)
VAQLAARELRVVLTGDGGDEIFAGYQRYIADAVAGWFTVAPARLSRAGSATASAVLGRLAPRSSMRRRADLFGELAGLDPDARYERLMRMMSPELERSLLHGDGGPSAGFLGRSLSGREPADRLDRILRTDTLTYLPEDLLVKMDRATMAVSLEARSPLLDHEVVEFAARLPAERKLHRGVSKVVLRQVAKTILPANLVDRPKKGFSVPLRDWFRGPLGERFRELALSPDAFLRETIDQAVATQLYEAHAAGRENHGHQLWLLLMLELWGRTWARHPVAA